MEKLIRSLEKLIRLFMDESPLRKAVSISGIFSIYELLSSLFEFRSGRKRRNYLLAGLLGVCLNGILTAAAALTEHSGRKEA